MSRCLYRNVVKVSKYFLCASRLAKYSLSYSRFEENKFKYIDYNYTKFRNFSSLSESSYEKVCRETLESLTEFFEELQERHAELSNADISYNDGVLTVNLGEQFGVYVINRQLPNKQIWLSSPTSGPKRYDYENNTWIYRHDNKTLYSILQEELSNLLHKPVDLSQCSHYKI